MDNVREFSYKINNLSIIDKSILKTFEEDFSNVKGVLGVKIDLENSKIVYAIDEWTSDYDVLCILNEICEQKGLDISFDDESEDVAREDVDNEVAEEIPEIEETIETDEDLSTIQEGDEFDEKEEKVKGKLAKSDFIEKAIIFGLALVATALGLFISGVVQPWILMIAFTLASYETLYDVIVKIAEKKYVLDDILTFGGALIFMYLGHTEISAIIMLIFSAVSFVKAVLTHKDVVKKEKLKQMLDELVEEDDKAFLQTKISYFEDNQQVCDKNSLKAYSNKLKFSIAFIVISILTIFIPPLFSLKTYWTALTDKWLYAGATVLTLSSLGEYFFGLFNTAQKAIFIAYENKVKINDYDKFLSFANADALSFEIDGVLFDVNGTVKDDLDGAIKELKYDLGIKSEILSNKKAEQVTTLKKNYEFSSAIAGASDKYKKDHLEKVSSIYVSNGESDGNLLSKVNRCVAFGLDGHATVLDGQLKRVPFIVKLAKRTEKILNFNKFFNLIFKLGLIVLTVLLTLLTSFKYALLIYGLDAVLKLITVFKSESNSSEVV